jgi:TRAP-type C4-dicarboxylate transport system permease large subunit
VPQTATRHQQQRARSAARSAFLSSYRFRLPLSEVYKSTLPYTVMLVAAVLLITYVPWLTLWLIDLYDG